jgi:hypothetical protein
MNINPVTGEPGRMFAPGKNINVAISEAELKEKREFGNPYNPVDQARGQT